MQTKKPSAKKRPKKKSELARVTPAATPVVTAAPLDAEERKLLAEALRLADETRDAMEDSLVGFGRWLLVNVFDDDAAAALGGRRENPVWRELLGRAGGPTLQLSERMLYVALHIAAHDKRINDETWRRLEAGRKEILLPLADEPTMREAAQHVTAMKLTQRDTRAYVQTLLLKRGAGRGVRVTAPRIIARVRKFRESVLEPDFQRRALAVLRKCDDAEVAPVRAELKALQKWAGGLLAKLARR